MTNKSDGSTASYYRLPPGCTELQDLISHRNLNAQDGEIFRAIYRKGRASHSDELRDARKVLFYAKAEVKRLEALATVKQSFTVDLGPAFGVLPCLVCQSPNGHGGLQCPTMAPKAGAMPADFGQQNVYGANSYPAVLVGVDTRFDQSGRQEVVEQNGNDGAAYLAGNIERHPERPRHQCRACGLGHSTHACTGGEP